MSGRVAALGLHVGLIVDIKETTMKKHQEDGSSTIDLANEYTELKL